MRADAGAVAASPVPLELDLDVFDGPFDLLVTLILKDEIDIWEVRVSRIIAEYVLQLADSGEFDLDATSQFVVLVAALLEMKSRLLLEEEVDEEFEELDPDEAAQRLLERLVRYSQFKNAAGALRERWDRHSGRLYRNVPLPPALCCRSLRRFAPHRAPRLHSFATHRYFPGSMRYLPRSTPHMLRRSQRAGMRSSLPLQLVRVSRYTASLQGAAWRIFSLLSDRLPRCFPFLLRLSQLCPSRAWCGEFSPEWNLRRSGSTTGVLPAYRWRAPKTSASPCENCLPSCDLIS